jgi:hypothetical protein
MFITHFWNKDVSQNWVCRSYLLLLCSWIVKLFFKLLMYCMKHTTADTYSEVTVRIVYPKYFGLMPPSVQRLWYCTQYEVVSKTFRTDAAIYTAVVILHTIRGCIQNISDWCCHPYSSCYTAHNTRVYPKYFGLMPPSIQRLWYCTQYEGVSKIFRTDAAICTAVVILHTIRGSIQNISDWCCHLYSSCYTAHNTRVYPKHFGLILPSVWQLW